MQRTKGYESATLELTPHLMLVLSHYRSSALALMIVLAIRLGKALDVRGIAGREKLRELLNGNLSSSSSFSLRRGAEDGTEWKCVRIPRDDSSTITSTCCLSGRVTASGQLGVTCLPSLVIAGFQKTGTTALASLLAENMGIRFPKQKEVHYFDSNKGFRKGMAWYVRQFPEWDYHFHDWQDPPLYAEATPFYISSPIACERMARVLPDVKIVVMVREPASRAYSEWQMKKRRVEAQDAFRRLFRRHGKRAYMCMKRHIFESKKAFKCIPEELREDVHWTRFMKAWHHERTSSGTDALTSLDACFGKLILPPSHPVAQGESNELASNYIDSSMFGELDEASIRETALGLYGEYTSEIESESEGEGDENSDGAAGALIKSQRLSDYESSFQKPRDSESSDLIRGENDEVVPCLEKATAERLRPFTEVTLEEVRNDTSIHHRSPYSDPQISFCALT